MSILSRISGPPGRRNNRVVAAAATTAVLAATAAWVARAARRAEQEHPPIGQFVVHDGVRLHYLERGSGTPVVLLHGNLVHSEDFRTSGLIDRLAERHRVIAFDRPGFGFSERPRDRLWTPEAQARLIRGTFHKLGLDRPIVVGHSWGTLVALAIAQRWPADVRKLVLLSGYYFPTARIDVALVAPAALPIVGDVMRYTVSALVARLGLDGTVKAMFAPQPVPPQLVPELGRGLLVRPLQIRANAEDAAFMIPGAATARKHYADMDVPAVIFAGEEDKVVKPDQARQLHGELRGSEVHVLPGLGHMLHYAVADQVADAIGDAASAPARDHPEAPARLLMAPIRAHEGTPTMPAARA